MGMDREMKMEMEVSVGRNRNARHEHPPIIVSGAGERGYRRGMVQHQLQQEVVTLDLCQCWSFIEIP